MTHYRLISANIVFFQKYCRRALWLTPSSSDVLHEEMFEVIRCGGEGGNEFLVLVPNIINRSDISSLASYLFTSFGTPILPSLVAMMLAASTGNAIFPDDGSRLTNSIKAADVTVYRAKAT